MGRRPKDAPKGAPLGTPKRLTHNQYILLSSILIRAYKHPGDKQMGLWREYPVVWSPKEMLGRSPTKNEAAALSQRLSAVIKHELVEKRGRMVSVTSYGKTMLRVYSLEREAHSQDSRAFRLIRMIVDRHEAASNIEAIQKTMNIARTQGRSELLTAKRGTLPDLYREEIKKLNELSREIDHELITHVKNK